jgi:hypothetical protein
LAFFLLRKAARAAQIGIASIVAVAYTSDAAPKCMIACVDACQKKSKSKKIATLG